MGGAGGGGRPRGRGIILLLYFLLTPFASVDFPSIRFLRFIYCIYISLFPSFPTSCTHCIRYPANNFPPCLVSKKSNPMPTASNLLPPNPDTAAKRIWNASNSGPIDPIKSIPHPSIGCVSGRVHSSLRHRLIRPLSTACSWYG